MNHPVKFIEVYVGAVKEYVDYARNALRPLLADKDLEHVVFYAVCFRESYGCSVELDARSFDDCRWYDADADSYDYDITKIVAHKIWNPDMLLHPGITDEAETRPPTRTLLESKLAVEQAADQHIFQEKIREETARFGILWDKSGSMITQANRFRHIRAVSPGTGLQAAHFRASLNANVLVFSGLYATNPENIPNMIKTFLTTEFDASDVHQKQILAAYDKSYVRTTYGYWEKKQKKSH